MLKKLFGSGQVPKERELSIEDLFVLERYQEAAERLEAKLKGNLKDLHSHLKLAEVYIELKQASKALDEFSFVADSYAEDGFYEKAIALLSKASKLFPADDTLRLRILKYQRTKELEHSRVLALDGLLHRTDDSSGALSRVSTLELNRIWQNLAGSSLVEKLSGDQLKRLFSAMDIVSLALGQVIATQGSAQEELYLVFKGTVEARTVLPGGAEASVRSFGAGDIIGERALFERQPWPATYRAAELGGTLKLTRAGFEKAVVGNPDPRGLIEALRHQGHDRLVLAAVVRLGQGG